MQGELPQFFPEEDVVRERRHRDCEDGAPAEVREHERRTPVPRARHHQHGWCGEVRECPADRHVHEEQAERGIFEALTRIEIVELPREQERADRHRRRLGHERPEHGPDGQDRHPPCRRCTAPGGRHAPKGRLGEADDRPCRRERHDHDDEESLGIVDGAAEVVLRASPIPLPPSPRRAGRQPRARRQPRSHRRSGGPPRACWASGAGPACRPARRVRAARRGRAPTPAPPGTCERSRRGRLPSRRRSSARWRSARGASRSARRPRGMPRAAAETRRDRAWSGH